MKRSIIILLTVAILVMSMSIFAFANSTVTEITDAKTFKTANLSGNVLSFGTASSGVESSVYRVYKDALTSFYYDSDIKYYGFAYDGFTVKADKNNFFMLDFRYLEFTLSARSFKAAFVDKNDKRTEITECLTDNKYSVTDKSITEYSVASAGGQIIPCKSNLNGKLDFETDILGDFKIVKFEFSDVNNPKKWYYGYINKSGAYGIMNGKGDNKFAPEANITRGELAAMIVKATENTISYRTDDTITYKDVKPAKWYAGYINKCSAMGIMEGVGDGKFEPDANATREQISAVVSRVLNLIGSYGDTAIPEINADTLDAELKKMYPDSSKISNYAKKHVVLCNKLKIMIGDSEGFRPRSNITRAESAKIFWLVFSANTL